MSGLGRVLIVGAAGQVGRELQRSFAGAGDIFCYTRKEVDLVSEEQVRRMVRETAPEIILNAAAYTAVDRAESEPELAMAINARAPRILAEEAASRSALLVHYSTDYVFDGTKEGPWIETDVPNPLNVYGMTKLAGEQAITTVGGRYLIFRTSWVYGPHGRNFMLTMLRLGRERDRINVVDDQIGAPTSSIEIADATLKVLNAISLVKPEDWAGIYHMACAGSTSWYGFANSIFAVANGLQSPTPPLVNPVSSREYLTAAKRPSNSVLSSAKLDQYFGVRLAFWAVALKSAIEPIPHI